MGDRLRNFLAWGVLTGALFSRAAQAENKEFFDTTGGEIKENTGKYNGINEEEAITKKGQEILNRFRDGRKSSNVTQTSRYSKILEHHDEDFDGVTDHDGAANALEGGMEDVALKGKKLRGAERQKELNKGVEEHDKACREALIKKDPTADTSVCDSPSAILVNKGAAHGGEADEHRVYELKKEAVEKAKAAGKQYGEQAIAEAGEWGDDPTPEGTKGIKDKDGRIRSMRVKNGKTGGEDVVKIAPDIDLMKSEYSYLEQLKDYQTNLEWKSLRAARLAGYESDKGVIDQFAGIWGKKGMTDQQKEQEVARRIDEMSKIGSEDVCINTPKTKATLPDERSGECKDKTDETQSLNEAYQIVALRPQLDSLREQLRNKPSNKPGSAREKKEQQQTLAQIQNCLGRDVWCPGESNVRRARAQARRAGGGGAKASIAAQKAADKINPFTAVQGDPGGTYKDTREYNMNRLAAANAGGLDNFMKVMGSADFSEGTDKKTDTKPFAQMKAEWEAAKKAADIVQGKQKDAERQRGLQNPNSANQYKGQNFDTKNMNTVKLFGRMRGRDGTTFQTEAMPGPGGMPAPGAPPAPPRRRAPGAFVGGPGAPSALPGLQ